MNKIKVYAISDLHLSSYNDKPMNVFGDHWEGHWEKISIDWKQKVSENDIVLIPGDISWAMHDYEAASDLKLIDELPGKKVLIKGNHDYWWSSYSKVKKMSGKSLNFIQNNAFKFENIIVCGTRGWQHVDNLESEEEKEQQDITIYKRELIRMELSLKEAVKLKKSDEDIILAMVHYPPFNVYYADSEFTMLFDKYRVNKVIYGHLHGKDCRATKIITKQQIPYYLTSCDLVGFELQEII